MNNFIRFLSVLFCISFSSYSSLFAQTYTVKSNDAVFLKSIDGEVLGKVAQGTTLYALQRKETWVQAVHPDSLTRGWISWKAHLQLELDKEKQERRRKLVQKEVEILKFGLEQEVTNEQLRLTIEWAQDLEKVCGKIHPVTLSAFKTATNISQRAGAFNSAEDCMKKSLEIAELVYGKAATETANIYLAMAHHFVDQGELAKGVRYAKSAILIFVDELGENHPSTAECWLPLANAMFISENYRDALRFFKNAESVYEKVLGPSDLKTIQVKTNIASCYEQTDNLEGAIESYEASITGIRKGLKKDNLNSLLRDSLNQQLMKTELALLAITIDLSDSEMIQEFRDELSRVTTQNPEIKTYLFDLENRIVNKLLTNGNVDNRNSAFEFMDRGMRKLRQALRKDLWSVPAERQNEYLSFFGGIQFFKAVSLAIDYQDDPVVRKKSLEWLINAKGLVREIQGMQAGAERDLTKRKQFVDRPFVGIAKLREYLPEKAVYVDILRYLDHDFKKGSEPQEKYAAWIVGKTGDVQIVELGDLARIDKEVLSLKAKLLQTAPQATTDEFGAFAELKPTLERVSKRIWQPIRQEFGDAEIVILSPDQTLWLLPWSAMLNPDGRFAVEKYQIQLELSGRDLIRKATSAKRNKPVVFANPEFGEAKVSSAGDGLRSVGVRIDSVGPLEFSALEAKLISQWLNRFLNLPTVYSGTEATEAKFKNLDSPDILVMSTHGFFIDEQGRSSLAGLSSRAANVKQMDELRKNPLLQCGLMLANANQHQAIDKLENDGVLTGPEIARTNLQNTRLAVLSACQTGVGTLKPTAGVMGMQSAFQAAGVQCVISTLWPIADEQTVDLTNAFFKNLSESRDSRSALHLAQKSQIEKRKSKNGAAHPFFWSAFTVAGNAKF